MRKFQSTTNNAGTNETIVPFSNDRTYFPNLVQDRFSSISKPIDGSIIDPSFGTTSHPFSLKETANIPQTSKPPIFIPKK